MGDYSVDTTHGESPPPTDCDPEVAKPVPVPFIPDRHPIRKGRNRNTTPSDPEPQLLPMNVAYSGVLDETRRPAPGNFRGILLVPNSCIRGCIQPTGRGNGASDIAV